MQHYVTVDQNVVILSDECSCDKSPEFCNYTCHNDYNIGDRYCDGIEDNFLWYHKQIKIAVKDSMS